MTADVNFLAVRIRICCRSNLQRTNQACRTTLQYMLHLRSSLIGLTTQDMRSVGNQKRERVSMLKTCGFLVNASTCWTLRYVKTHSGSPLQQRLALQRSRVSSTKHQTSQDRCCTVHEDDTMLLVFVTLRVGDACVLVAHVLRTKTHKTKTHTHNKEEVARWWSLTE